MSIVWQATGARRWIGIAAGVVVCGVVTSAVCARLEKDPLPEEVAQQVKQHVAESVVDTTEIHRLEHVAAQAEVHEQAAIAKAQESGVIAARSVTAPVPDIDLPQVQALTIASADKDSALAWAKIEVASIDTALARSEARAAQADSLLDVVVKVAEAREEPCRILWLVPCPTRKLVLIGTAIVTAVGVVRR